MCARAHDTFGRNGILLDYHVARHYAGIEAVYTYEGTDTARLLIVGREITGIQARTTRSYARSSRMSKEGNLDVSDRGEGNNETAVH